MVPRRDERRTEAGRFIRDDRTVKAISPEFGPPDRRRARIVVGTGTFPAPGLRELERFPSQRRAPLLAPLAIAAGR